MPDSRRITQLLCPKRRPGVNADNLRYAATTPFFDCGERVELNPTQSLSPENNRQAKQNHCDRHKRRAGDVSDQDEDDREDRENCCNAVVHSFLLMGWPTLPCKVIGSKSYTRRLRRSIGQRADGT